MLKRYSWLSLMAIVVLAAMVVACGGAAAPAAQTAAPVIQTVIQTSAPVIQTAAPVIQTVIVAGTPQVQVVTPTPAPQPTGPGSKSIDVIANWTGGEREAFQAVLDAFTKKTGIQVQYESARDNLEAVVQTRLAGGNPPDVAMEPRPGSLAQFARANNLIQLDASSNPVINSTDLNNAFSKAYIDLGTVDGKLYGIVFKADNKSMIWYRPADFKTFTTTPPATLTDLLALFDKMKAAGKTPFAIGGKDGWTLTDLFEDLYMRVATPQQYNDLHLTHKVAWTDPTVITALTDFTKFFAAGYEPSGTQGVLGTGFTDAISQVFGPNPTAQLYHGSGAVGTIATTTYPTLKPGTDISFFPFPQVDPQYGNPVEASGDFAMMLKDTPEGRAFMQYLVSADAANVFAGTNSISPNKLTDTSKFTSPLRAQEFQALANAKVSLFDGSDMAPPSLGGDYEFTELQKLVQNPGNVQQVATELENFAKTAY